MCPVKGGARQEIIFDTIQFYIDRGLDINDAIKEVESILRGKLPENIVDLIKQKFG